MHAPIILKFELKHNTVFIFLTCEISKSYDEVIHKLERNWNESPWSTKRKSLIDQDIFAWSLYIFLVEYDHTKMQPIYGGSYLKGHIE